MSNQPTLLLVDDEPDILTITIFRLKKFGYNVITARDGLSALEMMKEHMPDLVLLDVGIPNLNGYEVCRKMRTDQVLENIPVIIYTAEAEQVAEKSKECGANDYLLKPFEAVVLVEKVKKYIGS
jgi:two-component system alkaline phosphatase synthesis response regulator PhoP